MTARRTAPQTPQRGSAILLTYVTIAGLLVVTAGLFSRLLAEQRAGMVRMATVEAKTAADAGMEDALNWLLHGTSFGGVSGGAPIQTFQPDGGRLANGATYTAEVRREALELYRVIATGGVDQTGDGDLNDAADLTRTQTALVHVESTTQFAHFVNDLWDADWPDWGIQAGDPIQRYVVYPSTYRNTGPFHTNGFLDYRQWYPHFLGPVTLATDKPVYLWDPPQNQPNDADVFAGGWTGNVPVRAYPNRQRVLDAAKANATHIFQAPDHFAGIGVNGEIRSRQMSYTSTVTMVNDLDGDGTPDQVAPNPEGRAKNTRIVFRADCTVEVTRSTEDELYQGNAPPEVFDQGTVNPVVIYVDGQAEVSGTVCGANTIAATGPIMVPDHIRYQSGADNPGDDILGLIGGVNATWGAVSDLEIHAWIYGGIGVEWLGVGHMRDGNNPSTFWSHSPDSKGTMKIFGGVSQYLSSIPGMWVWDSHRDPQEWLAGYSGPQITYDPRAVEAPPPYFPTTGKATFLSWTDLRNSGLTQPTQEH